ncbi:alpha/beta hydrolase [Ottowia sp. GY511]|uniref:Alpha/beta hydrolase n=1 Tax=Ottowia flava TaxID=2675430 RepID=A0ABW4KPW6_9BURK|nr:alpha/beta fold hydrolase [Ottowia sp. GY511]TXK28325.1 alpha/beta hydrolase [Ottowia sp. GY511]
MKHLLAPLRLTLALTAGALLVACGGGNDHNGAPLPDPLASYRTQTLQWSACAEDALGESFVPMMQAVLAQYGERLRCSLMRAPLDWQYPARGDIVVAVSRLATARPEARRGALLTNPGGPGADGMLVGSLKLADGLARSAAASADGTASAQQGVLDAYDLVGFAPRGTGLGTRLECKSSAPAQAVDWSAADWDTPENLSRAAANDRLAAEACLQQPLAPHVHSEANARDMDLLRGLLGEDKLNFVGYSYGSWLGAWYAGLFPDKVGRMVLDGVVDFTSSFEQVMVLQAPARQRLFDEVLAPYAARHPAHFQLGDSAAAVRGVMPALSPRVQAVLSQQLADVVYAADDADVLLSFVAAAQGLDQVLHRTVPEQSDAVEQALEAQVFAAQNGTRDAVLRMYAKTLYQRYRATWVLPSTGNAGLSPFLSVYWATLCNDTAATTDAAAWAHTLRGIAQQAPMFFADNARNVCATWGGPHVQKPALAPLQSMDLLFVQAQYDGATPAEGADRFFAQLPQARRVSVQGSYQHGVYPYNDRCVDPLVSRYLLGQTPTARDTACATQALPQDRATAADEPSAKALALRALARLGRIH